MGIEAHKLKSLYVEKKNLDVELNDLHEKKAAINEKLAIVHGALIIVDRQILNLTKNDPVVTEHAIIRYLERKYDLDLKEVCKEILPKKVIQQYRALGDGKYPIGKFKAVIKNNHVVTVTK